jgi:hypothetical protein
MPGTREERIIRLERDILSKNGAFARANRDRLKAAGIFTLNLVSSPGSSPEIAAAPICGHHRGPQLVVMRAP